MLIEAEDRLAEAAHMQEAQKVDQSSRRVESELKVQNGRPRKRRSLDETNRP